ncbi:aldehyde dehydrogenase family protein [Sulfitobacter sp. G21635-S1]|uniref:aldehyde dehydrogenase family protein n=1 Tax=Sulfitobacter sp. G21635-S1 TaxID=3014043 RepID=UPI0022B065D0|nr:aldehyde dehydrogenase family protein [Sulfitobacter sp. G21635-S1]MCZ4258203.1 aldehyde dehydrogenase family protein [Sulfitobacter sp. G21635-S1]
MHRTRLYIDGTFTAPGDNRHFPAVDPATEETFAEIAAGQATDIDRAVRAARRAFDSGAWPGMDGKQRAGVLRRIAEGIRTRLSEIALLEVRDNGKPLPEAEWDVGDAAFCFDYYAELAEQQAIQPPETVDLGDPRFEGKIHREPLGVIGAITPWNFPLLMAVWKVAPALAAGCTIVLKPSEICSLSCEVLAQVIDAAGVPPGVFNLVTGTGPDAGQPLADHPLVDKLAFTGSVATGRKVMQAASAGIRTVSLELGGKSPFIIFDDCDIDKAVEWIMFGIFWNKGEVCSATSRVLVQRGIFDRLLDRLRTAAEAIRIGPGDQPGVKLGPLVSRGQYDKVRAAIDAGRHSGARLVTGGDRPAGFDHGYYLTPTIFADMPTDADIWREEVFGPVVCVNPFDTEEQALALANDSAYGLAGAVMSDDLDRCDRVAARLRAGIIWINCSQPTFTQVPWGGYKTSGIGRELGRAGFDACFETKQITRFDHKEHWGWYLDAPD